MLVLTRTVAVVSATVHMTVQRTTIRLLLMYTRGSILNSAMVPRVGQTQKS